MIERNRKKCLEMRERERERFITRISVESVYLRTKEICACLCPKEKQNASLLHQQYLLFLFLTPLNYLGTPK